MTGKNIVLCIDGTWNAPAPLQDTNVRKLFARSLVDDSGPGTQQVCCYLPGVGEDMAHLQVSVNALPPRRPNDAGRLVAWLRRKFNPGAGGAAGWGTAERIKVAYSFLCTHYRKGDRIFIFGFSRGAFAARSLAGFVSRIGVLLAARLDEVPQAYRLYEQAKDARQTWLEEQLRRLELRMIESQDDERALPIHFLGVWDTVGALGLPRRLAAFSAAFTEHHQVDVPPNVFAARHAMALHELRPDFDLMLWSNPARHPNLRQAWFPGDHADVGGGHRVQESGYADAALDWMAHEAESHGLRLMPRPGVVNHRQLHQQWLWFLVNSPAIRLEVRELTRVTGHAWDHALYCHDSVQWHLQWPPGRRYAFFSAGLNTALESVDSLAATLFARSRAARLIP